MGEFVKKGFFNKYNKNFFESQVLGCASGGAAAGIWGRFFGAVLLVPALGFARRGRAAHWELPAVVRYMGRIWASRRAVPPASL